QIASEWNDIARIHRSVDEWRQRSRPGSDGSYVAPRTGTEEMLAEIWEQVLPARRVGIHDNFFKLGGHSLLGTVTISRIRAMFGVELQLLTLFEAPTVAQLAETIDLLLIEADPDEMAELMGEP
ncbi:MAG: phosphopantetheine-binding protein, partial [Blastocatellia bacterium]